MAVDLDAVNMLSLACAVVMPTGSAIVNIASTSALRASPGTSAYAASKAGVIGLTQALAVDMAPRGTRVNAVAPGEVATRMGLLDPSVLAPLLERIPLGRQATADEIASVALFLVSPMASYVTGATWLVDGGFGVG
jgi:NAD(P)-dependent dehydrogenase (short-subunit alcohol dehydrogenase family)